MAKYITRTISTNHIVGYTLEMFEGAPHVVKIGECDVEGTSLTETDARNALRHAGIMVPRSCTVDIQATAGKTYRMSIEDFIKYAEEVIED